MGELPNDMILEIVMRLPLKYAIRCRTLNKYFRNNISIPKLLSSSSTNSTPIIIGERIGIIRSPPLRTETLTNYVRILDSCNGILFLENITASPDEKYYLFNPVTGGIRILSARDFNDRYTECWGLAINNIPAKKPSSSSSSFDFKIVGLQANNSVNEVQCRLQFCVYHVPLGKSGHLEKKYLYLDYHGSFRTAHHQPVYAHGCLHWLGSDYTVMAVFDVESERGSIMAGPLRNAFADRWLRYWFGLAQDSLHFILTDDGNNTIILHSHDYATQEWRVAHEIAIPQHLTGERRWVAVELFDGQSVVCNTLSERRDVQEIYVHDLSSVGEWNEIGEIEGRFYNWHCAQFVPTTARVSNVYLSSSSKMLRRPQLRTLRPLRPMLRRLQQILLGGS